MVNKKKSNLWENIFSDDFHQKNKSIESFRQIGGFNNRLTSWDAIETSSRYFKSLLYAFAENLDNRILQSVIFHQKDNRLGGGIKYYLKKIKNRSLGRPITINYYNNIVDLDYLLSVEEIFFLKSELRKSKNILEIGPGYGRLAHSILQNFKNIENYYIIDVDWMSELTRAYLKRVLSSSDFSKIEFISFDNYQKFKKRAEVSNQNLIDISINTNSFEEIEENIVRDYLLFISNNSQYFYSKNAICKYHPSSVDIKLKDKAHYEAALRMGLCKNVIDIYNSQAIAKQRKVYLKAYCPKNFKLSKDEKCFGQFLYYHSALYESKNS